MTIVIKEIKVVSTVEKTMGHERPEVGRPEPAQRIRALIREELKGADSYGHHPQIKHER